MIETKVWLKAEVIELIAAEFQEVRKDCQSRGVPFGAREAAECIYGTLADNFLIQLEP